MKITFMEIIEFIWLIMLAIAYYLQKRELEVWKKTAETLANDMAEMVRMLEDLEEDLEDWEKENEKQRR